MRDLLTDSLNRPAGQLAEVLIKRLPNDLNVGELPADMRARFEKLTSQPGTFGKLARVRLAAEVSLLFERAPSWTTANLLPLFDWSSPEAGDAWSARHYSNYIGSPELVGLTKTPFLELFSRNDVPDEELRTFSEWLTVIMLANQAAQANYPITAIEARSALRTAGVQALSSVAHRLAVEMEQAKTDEKKGRWRDVVGPIFSSIWPLDIELQRPETTFKLVQILRATGSAFPEAADMIIPFIRPEDPRRHTSVFSLSEADDVLYAAAPDKMLDLLSAIVGDAPTRSVLSLNKALHRLRAHAPHLADLKKFQKLVSAASAF